MLNLFSQADSRNCTTWGRRDFLRLGAVGLTHLSLPWWFNWQTHAEVSGIDYVKPNKSIIFLFLCGGPSQIETFAPNMDAPEPKCSLTGEVKTTLPGITFGGTFPKLASRMNRLAIVRSYSPHDIADHAKAIRYTFTGGNAGTLEASIGAMQTRCLESKMVNGVPPFAEFIENELENEYREDMERMRSSNSAGNLGTKCSPFAPDGSGDLNQNMKLNLPLERLQDRKSLLKELDQLQRNFDPETKTGALEEYRRQAVEVLLSQQVRRALDLSLESPKTIQNYDTSHMKTGWLQKRPSNIGKNLLLARRLCEAGCKFVTVGMAGWDNHGNERHPGVADGMKMLGSQIDHAVSALVDDLHDRGLEDDILLVMTGEFGRTPRIEKKGGRDHWPSLCSLLLAGGGLKVNQVIGKMRKTADIPDTTPIKLNHLMATMMHFMFDVGKLRVASNVPRELIRYLEGIEPIKEVF
jgi:hypothetical protein